VTAAQLAALIAASALTIAALAWDLHRLPGRLITRQARAFAEQTAVDLAFATITAHYEEPNP
jgi:hypothetical protein